MEKKKHSWSSNGDYATAIMVTSTPNGGLAAVLKEVAENEAEEGIKSKIVEKGVNQVNASEVKPGGHPRMSKQGLYGMSRCHGWGGELHEKAI